MDSGTTELDLLQQQLQDVSLKDSNMELELTSPAAMVTSDSIEQPQVEAETSVLDEAGALIQAETKTPEIDKVVLDVEQPKIMTEKEKYVQSKLNPTSEQEQKRLALKLQPGFMERNAGITAEQKLANFKQELEAEYEEAKELQSQTDFVVNDFLAKNFVPEKAAKGFWESEENRAAREVNENEARRKHLAETKRDETLLQALKQEIRLEMQENPEAIQELDKEEKAQALVQPVANKRISDTTEALSALRKDKAYTRYYAKPPVQPKKGITTDFPDLEAAIGLHFRYPLLQKELSRPVTGEIMSPSEKQRRQELIRQNQARSEKASQINKDVTDGRVLHGTEKKFKPVI